MARIGRYVIFLSVYTIGLAVTGGIFSYLLLWLFIIVSVPLHLLMPNVVSKMSMPHVMAINMVLFALAFALHQPVPALSKLLGRLGLIVSCGLIAMATAPGGVGR